MPIGKVDWIYRLLLVILFVCFVCTVTDFSGEDEASGVRFCTAVHRRPGQVISHFGKLCSHRIPKSDKSVTHPEVKFRRNCFSNRVPIDIARRVDVRSACVDIRPSPKTGVLVVTSATFVVGTVLYISA